MQLNIEEQTK